VSAGVGMDAGFAASWIRFMRCNQRLHDAPQLVADLPHRRRHPTSSAEVMSPWRGSLPSAQGLQVDRLVAVARGRRTRAAAPATGALGALEELRPAARRPGERLVLT
jgi:hypothetical protein